MVRTRNNSRTNSFGDPDAIDKITDARLNTHKIASAESEPRGISRVQPNRILVRNLVEPLRVAGAAVNERRQPEGRKKKHLSFIYVDIVPVPVAFDICGNGELGPSPVLKFFGLYFQ